MRTIRSLAAIAALACALSCHRHQAAAPLQPDASIAYGLGAATPNEREDAAKRLRDNDGPPPDAVPAILKALERENDTEAEEELLITLGASGAPEAKPILEQHLNDADRSVRKGAERGLDRWAKKNGTSSNALVALAKLDSPDPGARKDAANDLDSRSGVPANAVAALVKAASKEQDPRALEAMLSTLGDSGAPDAKPILDAHADDPNDDVRRADHKAAKKWAEKNGEVVRRDVETKTPPGAAPLAPMNPGNTNAAAPPSSAPTSDGCQQFKDICDKDPFSVEKCRADLHPFTYAQTQAWADCVNDSKLPCQRAHEACVLKAKKIK